MTQHPRSTLLAALCILTTASVAFAHDEGSELRLQGAAAGAEDEAIDDAAEEEEEELVVDEGDYCGDGGESPLDDADVMLSDENWKGVVHEVSTLLREGRAGWQRPTALSYLATAQLHLGRPARAARNFALAFRLDGDMVSPALRAEQAIALLASGQRRAALEAARTFAAESCTAPATWMQAACWSAHTVVARASSDAEERENARAAAEAVRPRTDDRLSEIAAFEQLLGDAPATRVASR